MEYDGPQQSRGMDFRIGRQRPYFVSTTRYFDTSLISISGPRQIFSAAIDKDLPHRSIYPLGNVFPEQAGIPYRIDFRVCFDFLGSPVFEFPMQHAAYGTMVAEDITVGLDYTQIVAKAWVANASANQPVLRVTHSSGNAASTACFVLNITADRVRYMVDYQLGGPTYLRGFLLISSEE